MHAPYTWVHPPQHVCQQRRMACCMLRAVKANTSRLYIYLRVLLLYCAQYLEGIQVYCCYVHSFMYIFCRYL